MLRPKIKEIKVTVEFEGKTPTTKTITVDPTAEAIFFTDKAVNWLGAFYDIYENGILTEDEALKGLGNERSKKILAGAKKIKIDSKKVEEIWNTNDFPAMMVKMPACKLEVP